MYVLIVDDDDQVREALIRLLERDGHRTCWAATGAAALAQMRIEQPDVVILDILLGPDMTGWDVAREKLTDEEIRGIPMIVLSGLSPDEVRQGARHVADALAGAIMLLSKPVEAEALRRVLDMLEAAK